jgi:beta-glucosidase
LPTVTGRAVIRFRDHDGNVMRQLDSPSASVKLLEAPLDVDPANLASLDVTVSVTAEQTGLHQLSILGVGMFSLSVDGQVIFDDFIAPDSSDFAAMFLQPPERRFEVEMNAGQTVDIVLTQQGVVTEPTFFVGVALGHAEPLVPDDDLFLEAEQAAGSADVAVVVVGTTNEVESEGFDRTTLALPGRQDELVRRVAAINSRTVVVVNAGSPVEMPWSDDVAAVLLTWFPGQEAGHALADVLLGAVEPGGRLPTTWPRRLKDAPVVNTTPDNGTLRYDEGLLIGYRAWTKRDVQPWHWFGHGLGYTTWAYQDLAITGDMDHDFTVTLNVVNTGQRAGREVVQLYVSDKRATPDRPDRWLAGFAHVLAQPGETVAISIPLPERALQTWDGGWRRLPAGSYEILAGRSVMEILASAPIDIA